MKLVIDWSQNSKYDHKTLNPNCYWKHSYLPEYHFFLPSMDMGYSDSPHPKVAEFRVQNDEDVYNGFKMFVV